VKKYYSIFIFFSYLISEESHENYYFNINNYSDDRFEQTLLHLDYNNLYRSTFLLDKYYPNITSDYNMYALKVSGTMKAPIYQLVPEKLFFDINKNGKISQLSYHEKKSYDYFDTKIALKVDLNEKVRFLGFAESKSFNNNINQNYMLNINKVSKKSILNFSYMYHLDDAPIEYMNPLVHNGCGVENYYGFSYAGNALPQNCMYKTFQKFNETFLFGFDYTYEDDRWAIFHNSAFQISNSNKESVDSVIELKFYEDYKWYDMKLSYTFNSKINVFIDNKYKKTIIKDHMVNNFKESYHNIFSVGFNYIVFNDFLINTNFDFISNTSDSFAFFGHDVTSKVGMFLRYSKPSYNIELGIENDMLSEYGDDLNENLEDVLYSIYSKSYIKFDVKLYRLENTFEFGNMDIKYNNSEAFYNQYFGSKTEYPYLLFNSNLRFNLFSVGFNYRFYDTDYTYINENISLEVSYTPEISNVRFRPYGKIIVNSTTFNSSFETSLYNIQLFELNDLNTNDHRVDIIKAELGFMFDSFKITYKIMNPFKERFNDDVHYGDNLLPHLGHHHTINVTWIFQD